MYEERWGIRYGLATMELAGFEKKVFHEWVTINVLDSKEKL